MFDPNHFSGEQFKMPLTVTSVTSSTGCGHQSVTCNLDGETIVVDLHDSEAPNACGNDYKQMLVKAAIQRKVLAGNTLASLSGKGIF